MIPGSLWMVTLALATALAAPTDFEQYQVIPQKRAALVLDRLLVALHHAIEDDNDDGNTDGNARPDDVIDIGPRTAPLRVGPIYSYDNMVIPQKRAALVLDRLLVALHHALEDDNDDGNTDGNARPDDVIDIGPRTAPLRVGPIYSYDNMSSLQRRGQAGPGRGRVLRCYFNAITCF